MRHGKSNEPVLLTHTRTTRRGAICRTAKLAASAALAALPAGRWVQTAQAEDDAVILIAGAAQVSASPGSAVARSAAAEAAAARGAARVQAAAALAEADSEEGAIAQGAAAVAAADPDQGAVAQSAVAVASAASQDDGGMPAPKVAPQVIAPAGRGGGRRIRGGDGGGGRADGRGMRAGMRAARGGGRERRRDRLASLPSAGIGLEQPNPLTSFLAMASAAAAAGAAIFRGRGETAQVAEAVIAIDD